MLFWVKNIRKFIYAFSLLLALFYFVSVGMSGAPKDEQYLQLVRHFAFAALVFLYLALLATPLYSAFANLPTRILHIKARRALGLSAFFFGSLHFYFAFFKLLQGFSGLSFLDNRYLLGISLSFAALVILTAMAATSFDYMERKLGRHWKQLHRFVYLAGVLIVIHALMLGSDFSNLSKLIPQVFLWALVILLVLQAARFDKYLRSKFRAAAAFSPVFVVNMIILTLLAAIYVIPHSGSGNVSLLGVHAQHILLAQQAQSNPTASQYSVVLNAPGNIVPGQSAQLTFTIYNLATGQQITNFDVVQEKLIHLVIVNSGLTYFSHEHPTLTDGKFTITTSFPKGDLYRLYLDFQPSGQVEQQLAVPLSVGNYAQASDASGWQPDIQLTKIFGQYKVILVKQDDFRAADMSRGLQTMTFAVVNASDNSPVTNIDTYLGAFGHLVLINAKTYQYVHVHPSVIAPNERATAGPSVDFLPLGLTGPISPGLYRAFAQFNIGGKLTVADFTIELK